MLPVLTEAGVVDAGAAGLVEIVRGIAAVLTGEPLPEAAPELATSSAIDAIHQELSRYRYCTVFVVEGDGLDADALEDELEPLGDSLLVVGDRTRAQGARPHRRPGPRAVARRRARRVDGVEIANMHAQTRSARSGCCTRCPDDAAATCAVVAVAAGDGNRRAVREPRRDASSTAAAR